MNALAMPSAELARHIETTARDGRLGRADLARPGRFGAVVERSGRPTYSGGRMRFAKWQGLGNDYLIVDRETLPGAADPEAVALLCDRHYGLGADGILVHDAPTGPCPAPSPACASTTPTAASPRCAATACACSRATCAARGPSRPTSSSSRPSPAPSSRACSPTDGCGCTWGRRASARPTTIADGPGAAAEVVDETLDAAGATVPLHLRRRGQPALRHPGGRPGRPAPARDRPGHRAARLLPQPGERGVRAPRARRLGVDAGLGTGRGRDPGVRHRRDRGGGGGGAAGTGAESGDRAPAGRRPARSTSRPTGRW